MDPIKPNKKPKIVSLDMFVLAILAVAIGISFYFVGGLTPGNFKPTAYQDTAFYMPSESSEQGPASQGLQLSLIKLQSCSSTVAVDFLVDKSGSMDFDGGKKIANLRNALLSFKNKLGDESIIGLQAFSDNYVNPINPTEYKNVKATIHKTVCSLRASGGTYTRTAFSKTQTILNEAIAKYPNHKFALIFISDGVPEDNTNAACPGGIGGPWCGTSGGGNCRCFSRDQDPTNYYDTSKPDIPKEIKDKGVRIFTISYVDKTDAHLNSLLEGLMKRIASSDEDYYSAPDETKIKEILDEIGKKICQEAK